MSKVARLIALVAAIAMFCFSLWTYSRTGDWVAMVFVLGSAAYGVFFITSSTGENR